jgi:mRNA-degrading endonuclease toxin of MazEF toxin-antitoxin module
VKNNNFTVHQQDNKKMKDFDGWNKHKKHISIENEVPPYWNVREIWWVSLGINVGHEQDGKNKEFSRPVLVIKKFNSRLFWGIPLTTQIKDILHYHYFEFKGKPQCAMLTQMRLLDASRMTEKIGRLGKQEFEEVCIKLKKYIP